jgi:hypothetical protein
MPQSVAEQLVDRVARSARSLPDGSGRCGPARSTRRACASPAQNHYGAPLIAGVDGRRAPIGHAGGSAPGRRDDLAPPTAGDFDDTFEAARCTRAR